jgi:hypothetical protein
MPNDTVMEQALANSVQSASQGQMIGAPISLMMLLAKVNDIIAPWWSRRRDLELRSFTKSSDHLSGAVFNMCAKMTAIPVKVEAKDKSIKTHVKAAEEFTDVIINGSQFGEGWVAFYGKFIEDLLTQDNGAFAEIIGPGKKDGPLTGMPISIAHMDSARCLRTGSPEYPVVYEDISGKMYKLHYSRVWFASQQPSTDVRMCGVGFCAASRAINSTQNLIDISTYKQEKLGSRPPRKLMITGGGLDPEDIQLAVQMSERAMSNAGFTRFSKTIVAGNRNILDPRVEEIDLASLPDGFDEKESTILGMSVIAMAFGMDAKELFPMMEGGASKADAIVQHMKQRGKGPGQILQITETGCGSKMLPPYLQLVFDYQDDAQDRQAAEIRATRSQSRQRDLITSVTNVRLERQLMLENKEISLEQFEELELSDGRLVDGLDVEILFESEDKDYVMLLSGTTDANFEKKKTDIQKIIMTSKDVNLVKKSRRALAAIYQKYEKPLMEQEMFEQQIMMQSLTGRANRPTGEASGDGQARSGSAKPGNDNSSQEERFGRKLGRDEVVIRGDQQADLEE